MKVQNERRKDILELINIVSTTKNIDKKIIIGFLKNSIQRIINSQLDPDAEIALDIVDNELILTNLKKLVIDDEEEYKGDSKVVDIHLSEAREINPTITVGETIASKISFDDFSRSLYSKIEQSFRIEILNWEKRRVYEKYQPLIGTVVEAKLEEDFGGKGATFLLEDGTLCYMPTKYQNQKINLNDKKYHNVTIEEVYESSKSYQVLVSNDSPNKVREILKREIPEIDRGEIQIVGISRIKGDRSKISFRKNPKFEGELDIKGCIIGQNSERINRVSNEIGEKIDVILYSDNIYEYIANALSPARIVSINKKAGTNDYLVVVPNKHNTIAIGKKGSNVKLTVELIRVNIDICSYSYAIENNIPINWNGNINEKELEELDSGFVENKSSSAYLSTTNNRRPRNNRNNWKNINISNIEDFEKEIAEYNSEILSYEPVDYSQFSVEDKTDKIENDNFDKLDQNFEQKINNNEIKRVNENFKFDKDLVGDIDLNDYDFLDFDEEEDF
ncbi:NusA N-terminal domain-containing protein [Mesomycoplasma moatsii]|uniref:NusA N-terminal domain-containing protein n=1 Tax=Mesomycoplasma moatsii TaxID=171287 RepID=UPI0003B66113